jgi:transposase InsO family protein
VKYACIAEHRALFAVTMMCRVLGVSRAGFYAAQVREPSERSRNKQRLLLEIRSIHTESKQRYGSPRVHDELRAREFRCSENQVALLMREDGLRAKKRRSFRITTNSDHAHEPAENVLDREFAVKEQEQADRVWVADITYIPTREGWLYLAIILDLASRMVVGWSLQRTLDRSLSLSALRMALQHRRPGKGLLHHSDRGVQYACHDYRGLLEAHGIVASMSRKGNCWDNAVAESFFATMEWELIEGADWHTREEAGRAISEYIEIWYNRKRRHSSLGGKSPAEYEHQLALTLRAAY